MQYLAVLRRRTEAFPADAFAQRLDAEAQRVRELYAAGFVRAAWSRDDVPGACLLLEARSESEAETTIATLPFAAAGMVDVQIIPLRGYRGFSA